MSKHNMVTDFNGKTLSTKKLKSSIKQIYFWDNCTNFLDVAQFILRKYRPSKLKFVWTIECYEPVTSFFTHSLNQEYDHYTLEKIIYIYRLFFNILSHISKIDLF